MKWLGWNSKNCIREIEKFLERQENNKINKSKDIESNEKQDNVKNRTYKCKIEINIKLFENDNEKLYRS